MSDFPRRAAARYQAQPGVAETNTDGPPFVTTPELTFLARPNVNNLTGGGVTAVLPSSVDLPPGTTCTITMPDYSGDVTIDVEPANPPNVSAQLDLGPVTANVDSVIKVQAPGSAGNLANIQFVDDGDLYVSIYGGKIGQGFIQESPTSPLIDMASLGLPSACATIVSFNPSGPAGNSYTLEFIGDSVGGAAGQLDEGPPAFVFHFMPGTTTIRDFEFAVQVSVNLGGLTSQLFGVVNTTIFGAGDAFGPTNFSGGIDGFPQCVFHFTPGLTNIDNFESQISFTLLGVVTPDPSPITGSTLDLGPLTANVDTVLFNDYPSTTAGWGVQGNAWNIEMVADGPAIGTLDYLRINATTGPIVTASASFTFTTLDGASAGQFTLNAEDGDSYTIELIGDSPPAGGVTVTRTGAYPNLAWVFHYESGVSDAIEIHALADVDPLTVGYLTCFVPLGATITSPGDDIPPTSLANGYNGRPNLRFHFQPGVTTVTDFQNRLIPAIVGDDLFIFPGTGTNVFAAGDVLAQTFFAGGSGPVFASPGDLLPATFFSGGVGPNEDLKWGSGYGDAPNYSTTWQTDGAGNWYLRTYTAGE